MMTWLIYVLKLIKVDTLEVSQAISVFKTLNDTISNSKLLILVHPYAKEYELLNS